MESDLQTVLFEKDNKHIVNELYQKVRYSEGTSEFFSDLTEDLKLYFNCEAVTIFAVDQSAHQLYSQNHISDKISEMRLNISLKNLPGFVAGTGNSLNIFDVKDPVELAQYHPQLSHDSSWDDTLNFTTKSIIIVPLPFNKNLIGILEIINKREGNHFSLAEFQLAKEISSTLGLALSKLNNDTTNQEESTPEQANDNSHDCEASVSETSQSENSEQITSAVTAVKKKIIDNPGDESDSPKDIEKPFEEYRLQTIPSIVTAVKKKIIDNSGDESHSLKNIDESLEEDHSQTTPSDVTALKKDPVENLSGISNSPNDVRCPLIEAELQSLPSIVTAVKKNLVKNSNDKTEYKPDDNKPFNKEEFQKLLDTIKTANFLDKNFNDIHSSILNLFDAESIILYRFNSETSELDLAFSPEDQTPDIHLSVSPNSVAGYAAMAKMPLNIANVNTPVELSKYHPELHFNDSWDRHSGNKTIETLTLPLLYNEKLSGVLQLLNKKQQGPFTENDFEYAVNLAENLARAFLNQKDTTAEKQTKFSYLLENNLISEKALASSIAHAKSNQLDLELVLLQELKIKREHLGLSLANFHNLPYYGFNKSILLPQKVIGGLNKNFLAKNFWIPIKSDDSKVVILINDPTNPHRLQNIRHIFSRKEIEFQVGLKIDIIDFLNSILEQGEAQFDGMKTEKMSSLISNLQEKTKDELFVSEERDESEEIQSVHEKDSAIIQLVNKILVDAYEREVSDIHIEPGVGKENLVVRFRKEGECHNYEEIPAIYKQGIISRIKIMARLDIAEKRLPQDGKFAARYGNKQVEFRVATCPTVGGNEDAVLRILSQSKMSPLEEMNFTTQNLDLIKNILIKPYGLVLVVLVSACH